MERFKSILRTLTPYAAALAIFYAVSAFCFAPQFEGKVLPQHDIEQYDGMWSDIRRMREATGEDAQWTGGMFGGMPAYLINVEYPSQIVKNTIGNIVKAVKTPAGFIFFAMTAMWLMMLMLGMSPWAGIVPALAYGLSTYFFLIIGAGHVTKMWALVYAPLMMGGAWMTLRGNMWAGGVLTALFTSLEIGANHPQITYYFLLAMAAFWISELVFAIRGHQIREFCKRTGVLAVAGIVALGSNFAPLWYTSQHSGDTIRGGSELAAESAGDGLDLQYATAWSYGIGESWNMLIPDFEGRDSASTFSPDGPVGDALSDIGLRQAAAQLPTYWGEQPYTAGPTYLGAAAIFLALLGLMLISNRNRWWIAVVMLLMLLLAWGHNFMGFTEFCFKYLPFYNKFRTVSTTLVVLEWAVPLLAGAALWKMWKANDQARRGMWRPIAWAAGITGGLCLLFAVAGSSILDFGRTSSEDFMIEQFYHMFRNAGADDYIKHGVHEQLGVRVAAAMVEERAAMMSADAWRSFIFIVLAAAATSLFALRKIHRGVLAGALAVIVLADMLPVDMRFMPRDRFVAENRQGVKPTQADLEIMKDKDPGYRVLNLTVSPFNDATTSYFHRSVGGYHGAKLARYQDLIDRYLSQGDEGVLDMLNTRYVINPDGSVTRRDSANGAAWLIDGVVPAADAGEEIDLLGRIDTRHTAVFSPKGNRNLPEKGPFGDGEISLAEYRPNYLRYEYTADDDAFAVFSEIFYDKGWKAYIDGNEAPYCRVDYLLRGMRLPEGTHTVEWRFRAPAWGLTSTVTAIFSLIILAGVVTLIIWTTASKRKKQCQTQTAD